MILKKESRATLFVRTKCPFLCSFCLFLLSCFGRRISVNDLHTENQIGVLGTTFVGLKNRIIKKVKKIVLKIEECVFQIMVRKRMWRTYGTVRYDTNMSEMLCTYQAWIDKSEFFGAEEHIVHSLYTCKIIKDEVKEDNK